MASGSTCQFAHQPLSRNLHRSRGDIHELLARKAKWLRNTVSHNCPSTIASSSAFFQEQAVTSHRPYSQANSSHERMPPLTPQYQPQTPNATAPFHHHPPTASCVSNGCRSSSNSSSIPFRRFLAGASFPVKQSTPRQSQCMHQPGKCQMQGSSGGPVPFHPTAYCFVYRHFLASNSQPLQTKKF